jgi:uncharacterized protein (TIGR02271 family)
MTYNLHKENAMAYERVVALYDRAEKAKEAARALESSGFDSSDINVSNGGLMRDKDVRSSSVWQRIFGRSVSDQESTAYGHTITSGGAVLTLRTADTEVDRAIRILNAHGPMNLHDRSASAQASTTGSTSTAAAASATPATDTGRMSAAGEEVLRLAEEQIEVGKRQVAAGKSRIRRFVTEKPVEQQISLHEEHVEVTRRDVPDSKLVDGKDIDWKDRTIEVSEMSEQPVVSKTARIAEEVVIRRRGSDHVETIRDTVRRQQAEVERVPEAKPDLRTDLKKAA